MVLDKGMGVDALKDWVQIAGKHVDIVKLGWGTSGVVPEAVLREKIRILRENEILVCPGGTFLEIAYAQRRVDPFLQAAHELGFSCIEVSDGTVSMPHADKIQLIRQARDGGFTVLSEVGKKFEFEDQRYPLQQRVDDLQEELRAGAQKVILEARESGTFGIFNTDGEVIPEHFEAMLAAAGIQQMLFEAPRASQQQWLVTNLGNSVNLGNVAPEDCINLETLRLGLRAGTLKEYHLDQVSVSIEQGVGGALHAASKKDVIIVVDALRCSSTVIAALAAGVTSIRPVVSADECVGEVTAGERGGKKIPGLDDDNSPISLSSPGLKGKKLVLTTTNGTECIKTSASYGSPVLIGALINAGAVAKQALRLARELGRNISIVMAGRNNQLAPEDLISASEIVAQLDDVTVKGYIRPIHAADCAREFLESDSGRAITAQGRRDDVLFCAQKDTHSTVPIYSDGLLVAS
jgi:2-phosphosulfolactate phosphatase